MYIHTYLYILYNTYRIHPLGTLCARASCDSRFLVATQPLDFYPLLWELGTRTGQLASESDYSLVFLVPSSYFDPNVALHIAMYCTDVACLQWFDLKSFFPIRTLNRSFLLKKKGIYVERKWSRRCYANLLLDVEALVAVYVCAEFFRCFSFFFMDKRHVWILIDFYKGMCLRVNRNAILMMLVHGFFTLCK